MYSFSNDSCTFEQDLWSNTIYDRFVVNLTDTQRAQSELILKTKDPKKIATFAVIAEYLGSFCCGCLGDDAQHMGTLIASSVFPFLFEHEHEHRIGCVFCTDERPLFAENQWRFNIAWTLIKQRAGIKTDDIQQDMAWDREGYMCDLCRKEMSHFEMSFHCGDVTSREHDLCISCVYAVLQQHEQMMAIVTDALELMDVVTDDCCARQIVEFCVDRVVTFHR